MKNYLFLFLLGCFIFGTACNNDDDNAREPEPTGYERIVDKNFRLTDLVIRANGIIIADSRDLLACELDNVNRYENTGTAITNYGALRCDTLEPNEDFYFWTLISNDSKLILDYGGPNLRVFNIILNDGSRLVLERFTIEDVDGDGTQESVQTTTTYQAA